MKVVTSWREPAQMKPDGQMMSTPLHSTEEQRQSAKALALLSSSMDFHSKESLLSSRGLERLRSSSMSFRSMGQVPSSGELVQEKQEALKRLVL
jgi:hypothetical protein